MVPVTLFDALYFVSAPSGRIRLTCQSAVGGEITPCGLGEIPTGYDNIVVQAVRLLRERSGTQAGAEMRLVKRIPMAAGLGGGSSDAAAALAVANKAWELDWPGEKLGALAVELGSDVPFFFAGGAAVCRGRGERVERVHRFCPLHFVVLWPGRGLSTAHVYDACQPATRPRRAWPLVQALQRGELAQAGRMLYNRLEPAAETLAPWIGDVRREFERLDCVGHQMSGSGTSFFGVCRSARHARHVAGALRSRRLGTVFLVTSQREVARD
jgi:4-diphosphocytidyl-2-C-methyl-D-erythritol kinase